MTKISFIAAGLLFMAMSSVTAGTIIRSVPVTSRDAVDGAQFYGEYSVADTVIKIVVSQTPDPAAKASATDPSGQDNTPAKDKKANQNAANASLLRPAGMILVAAATTPPPAIQPAGPVSNGQPGQQVPQADAGSASDSAATCDADLKAYNQARIVAIRGLMMERGVLAELKQIREAALVNTLTAPQKQDALKIIDAYIAKKPDANIKAVTDVLNKWVPQVDSLRQLCPLKLTASITKDEEPAVDHTYRLYFKHDDFSNDTFTITQSAGLLTTVSLSADDQTGAIAIVGAKLLGEVAFLAGPQAAGAGAAGTLGSALEGQGGLVTYSLKGLQKAESTLQAETDVAQTYKDLTQIIAMLDEYTKLYSKLPNLSPMLPIEVDLHMASLNSDQDKANAVLKSLDLNLDSHCGQLDAKGSIPNAAADGIFVSALRACSVELDRDSDIQGFSVLARVGFVAQDSTEVMLLPFERGLFVLDKTDYEFADGRLTKSDISRQSEVLGAVSLPLQLIQAFFGSIADGIKGKSSVIDAETARFNSQTSLLNSKKALIQAQTPSAPSP